MRRLLPLGAAVLAVAFAWVVPLGESPDELAHLRYAEALASGGLPALWKGDAHGYEAHQPPLGYLLPALVLAVAGGVEVAPVANAQFDFRSPGSRAFLPPFADARDRIILRLARSTQAIWAALTVWAGLVLCDGRQGALAFLLAPQLLFVCGAINNDAALIAGVSCALLLLVRFAATGEHAVGVGLLVTAALFTKGSALFLLVPVVVAAGIAPLAPMAPLAPLAQIAPMPRRDSTPRFSPRVVLLSVTAAGLAAWSAFNFARFGTVLPPVPTATHVATVSELLTEPRWIGGLFRSFWAKFGWLNTPLPWPFYLWFAALSIAVVVGLRRRSGPERLVLASALVANAGLVLAYQLTVDMQAQGRYLLPSLAAVAAFGSAALPARLQPVLDWGAVFVALAAIATIALAYA